MSILHSYSFVVTIPSGSDDFWEEMKTLDVEKQIELLKQCITEELFAYDAVVEPSIPWRERMTQLDLFNV